jgi:hypothetical protein
MFQRIKKEHFHIVGAILVVILGYFGLHQPDC